MGGIGGQELFLLFLVVLLVFGPKKIPEVARGLGKGLRELRRLSTDLQREVNLASTLGDEEAKTVRPQLRAAPGPPSDPSGPIEAPGPTESPGPIEAPGKDDPPGPDPATGSQPRQES